MDLVRMKETRERKACCSTGRLRIDQQDSRGNVAVEFGV